MPLSSAFRPSSPALTAPWPPRAAGEVLLMGIVNVTPDSFSDGGRYAAHDKAIAHGGILAQEGAHILDIGGESTRPGFAPVEAEEEQRRILPVITALAGTPGLPPVSVDTYKAATARLALRAGARIVNDVWGLQRDPAMADVVAEHGAGLVLMHNRDEKDADLDIVAEMERYFGKALLQAERAGIARSRIVLDPGLGFGKTHQQNLAAIRALPRLKALGCATLLGVSQKSFLGVITGRPVGERLAGTLATALAGVLDGVDILRVHDIAAHRDVLAVMAALKMGSEYSA